MWQSALRTHRYRFSSIVYAFRISLFFFFNDTATTEIYTLSLHDALPICVLSAKDPLPPTSETEEMWDQCQHGTDRKSTRLNSSHLVISYAVFCLKKKKLYYISR